MSYSGHLEFAKKVIRKKAIKASVILFSVLMGVWSFYFTSCVVTVRNVSESYFGMSSLNWCWAGDDGISWNIFLLLIGVSSLLLFSVACKLGLDALQKDQTVKENNNDP